MPPHVRSPLNPRAAAGDGRRPGGRGSARCAWLAWLLAWGLGACGGGGDEQAEAARRGAQAATPRVPSATQLMDWAEQQYPQLFPSHQADRTLDPYLFRFYPDSGNYIGVAGSGIYLLGPVVGSSTVPAYVGELAAFGCQVFPVDCNTAPVADAGAAQAVAAGATVLLDGRASHDADGDPLAYRWTLATRPAGSSAALDTGTGAQPRFVADRAGVYVATLVVNDGKADSASASVQVRATAVNAAPVADPGEAAQRALTGTSVMLDGSASTDPDGDLLSYQWVLAARPAGSSAVLGQAQTARPSFHADVAGTYVLRLVVNDGRVSSPPAQVEVVVAASAAGSLFVEPRRDMIDRAALDSLLGGPLLAAWNPTSAGGPGMKIMMFGAADSACPAGTTGPLGEFSDAALAALGYPGAASAVPVALRFEAKPAPGCGAGASGKRGPSRVFMDGSRIWLSTATLGGPDDLLRPFTATGQDGQGSNFSVLNTSVNYRLPYPNSPVRPWAGGSAARLAAAAGVARLQVTPGSLLNQVKQQMSVTFDNAACRAAHPGRLCSIQWLFALAIAQSDVTDWSTVGWAQGAYAFGDPVQGNMPIIDVTLIPRAGRTGKDRDTQLPFFTSRGEATQHAPFELRNFAVDIDFEQMKNALRVASARMLGEPVAFDAACGQCQRVFGDAWNDPTAWMVDELLSMQEIHDRTGHSAIATGSYAWLYIGPVP